MRKHTYITHNVFHLFVFSYFPLFFSVRSKVWNSVSAFQHTISTQRHIASYRIIVTSISKQQKRPTRPCIQSLIGRCKELQGLDWDVQVTYQTTSSEEIVHQCSWEPTRNKWEDPEWPQHSASTSWPNIENITYNIIHCLTYVSCFLCLIII